MNNLLATPKVIVGAFWQGHTDFYVRSDEHANLHISASGNRQRYTFFGIIQPDPERRNYVGGGMIDTFGKSSIQNVVIGEKGVLSFEKQYEPSKEYGHRTPIKYRFFQKNGIWCGVWSGSDAGAGEATCEILPCQLDKLFDYETLMKNLLLLGK